MREAACLSEVGEFEAGGAADLLGAAQGSGTAAAVHCIEGVLKRSYERAFTGREGHEKLTRRCASSNAYRSGNPERDAREADKTLDAAGKSFGIDFSTGAADLLNRVARRA